eukprot:c23619_g1_i2 orf=953-1492(+)
MDIYVRYFYWQTARYFFVLGLVSVFHLGSETGQSRVKLFLVKFSLLMAVTSFSRIIRNITTIILDALVISQISGQDKLSQGRSSQHNSGDNHTIQDGTTVRSDPIPQMQMDSVSSFVPPSNYLPISANNYLQPTLSSHGHQFSTLSYAQDHNSRLLALGQFGLRAQVPARRHGYLSPSY